MLKTFDKSFAFTCLHLSTMTCTVLEKHFKREFPTLPDIVSVRRTDRREDICHPHLEAHNIGVLGEQYLENRKWGSQSVIISFGWKCLPLF